MQDTFELNFQTLDELSEFLEFLGCSLHVENRVAFGECDLLFFLAETMRKAGRVAALASAAEHCDDLLHGFEVSKVDADVMRFLSLLAAQPTQ